MIRVRHKRNAMDDVIAMLSRIVNLDKASTDKIADVVRAGHAANFAGQRAGDGAPWAPLKPTTQLDRRRHGFPASRPILVRAGDYRRSFTEAGDSDHIQIVEKTGTGVRIYVGSKAFRLKYLEEGTGSMPAREVLPLSASAQAKVGTTIETILDLLVKHGR